MLGLEQWRTTGGDMEDETETVFGFRWDTCPAPM